MRQIESISLPKILLSWLLCLAIGLTAHEIGDDHYHDGDGRVRARCTFSFNILDKVGFSEALPNAVIDDPERIRLRTVPHHMKIEVDISNVRGVTQDQKDYLLKTVMPEGNKILSSKIKLRSNQFILRNRRVGRVCPYRSIVKIPEKYEYTDVNADVLLFLATDNTGDNGTLAYAAACLLDQDSRRPVAGFVVINPFYLNPDSGNLENHIATYVHEVLHVLIFNRTLWDNFPPLGNGLSQHFTASDGNPYLRGRNLLREVQRHFNCSTITRVPLEDDGKLGSKGGHFDRFVFGDETMGPEDVLGAKFSRMTLALMADSGWYDIDLDYGDYYFWGRQSGCSIFNRTCPANSQVEEICTPSNEFGCSKDFKYRMGCRRSGFSNGCKIKQKKVGRNCQKDFGGKFFFETAGPHSRCQELRFKNRKFAGCVKIICNRRKDAYQVSLRFKGKLTKYACRKQNQVFQWGPNFRFFCENPRLICANLCPKNCNFRGRCLDDGRCQCDPFYSGPVCGTFSGCGGLSRSLCQRILKSNKLSTRNLSNKMTANDITPNFFSFISFSPLPFRMAEVSLRVIPDFKIISEKNQAFHDEGYDEQGLIRRESNEKSPLRLGADTFQISQSIMNGLK